jgi:hypothetical protein
MTNQYLLFRCTNLQYWGCERAGNPVNILSPVKSARLRTVNSFAFKYGKVEISAKMPTGDWLWPGKCITNSEITRFFQNFKMFPQLSGFYQNDTIMEDGQHLGKLIWLSLEAI